MFAWEGRFKQKIFLFDKYLWRKKATKSRMTSVYAKKSLHIPFFLSVAGQQNMTINLIINFFMMNNFLYFIVKKTNSNILRIFTIFCMENKLYFTFKVTQLVTFIKYLKLQKKRLNIFFQQKPCCSLELNQICQFAYILLIV